MSRIVTLIDLTSGAYANVSATTFSRRVQIQEDETGPPGGIVVKWPNGTVAEYTPGQQPLQIGGPSGGSSGSLVGLPSQPSTFPGGTANPATVYCQVKSLAATSVLQLIEDN